MENRYFRWSWRDCFLAAPKSSSKVPPPWGSLDLPGAPWGSLAAPKSSSKVPSPWGSLGLPRSSLVIGCALQPTDEVERVIGPSGFREAAVGDVPCCRHERARAGWQPRRFGKAAIVVNGKALWCHRRHRRGRGGHQPNLLPRLEPLPTCRWQRLSVNWSVTPNWIHPSLDPNNRIRRTPCSSASPIAEALLVLSHLEFEERQTVSHFLFCLFCRCCRCSHCCHRSRCCCYYYFQAMLSLRGRAFSLAGPGA